MKCAKQVHRKARVVRIRWELDLCDDEDLPEVPPTRATHPELYYPIRSQAYARLTEPAVTRRRVPPSQLSCTQLRKRLSQAGLRGQALRQTLAAIRVGPRSGYHLLGTTVLGWSEDALRSLLGRRVYRIVTRFLARHIVVLDEFGSYVAPGFVELLRACRTVNAAAVQASQSLADFDSAATRQAGALSAMLSMLPPAYEQLPSMVPRGRADVD